MIEEFRPIKDFERYYISNFGRVLNTKTGKFLKMIEHSNGYFVVALSKNGKAKIFSIHRLVAQTFIDNPNNYNTVDHLNGIKSDNRVENLQWLSQSDNIKKFHREQITEEWEERHKMVSRESIKKAQEVCKKTIICIETGKIYESVTQASEELNLNKSLIVRVCKGKRKTAGGYHFEYL